MAAAVGGSQVMNSIYALPGRPSVLMRAAACGGILLAVLAVIPSLPTELMAPKRWALHALALGLLAGTRPRWSRLELLVAGLASWVAISAALSPIPVVTLRPGLDTVAALAIVLGVARSRLPRHVLLTCLEVALLVTAAGALFEAFFPRLDWVPVASRPAGTLGSRSVAAEFVSGVLPLMVALRRPTRWRLLTALLGTALLVATRGRAAWLGASLGLGLAFWRARRHHRRPWAVALALGLLGGIGASNAPRLHWVSVSPLRDSLASLADKNSWSRAITWRNSLHMWGARPLAGFGPGGFRDSYAPFARSREPDPSFNVVQQIESPHSEPLRCLVELGLPGFVLAVLLCVGWIGLRGSMPGPLPALAALGVSALVSQTLTAPPTLLLASIVVGLLWRRRASGFVAPAWGVALALGALAIPLDIREHTGLRQEADGRLELAAGRGPAALSDLSAAAEALQDPIVALEAAEVAVRVGDSARCDELTQVGLKAWPAQPRLEAIWGTCALMGGRLEQADQRFGLALEHLPENYLALMGELEVVRRQGDRAKARETAHRAEEVLSRAIENIPSQRNARELVEAEDLLRRAHLAVQTY